MDKKGSSGKGINFKTVAIVIGPIVVLIAISTRLDNITLGFIVLFLLVVAFFSVLVGLIWIILRLAKTANTETKIQTQAKVSEIDQAKSALNDFYGSAPAEPVAPSQDQPPKE